MIAVVLCKVSYSCSVKTYHKSYDEKFAKAQGPVAWNARNNYAYTYVHSQLKWVALNHLSGPLREFN